jgi:hypothetical protein
MSEESNAIREEAQKTRRLIIRICIAAVVIVVIAWNLHGAMQEVKESEARIDAGVQEIMDQVGP